jgi:hypothetical protein
MTTALEDTMNTLALKPTTTLRMHLQDAIAKGVAAGNAQLEALRAQGPKWGIKNEMTGRLEGTMLDVCGFASCKLPSQPGISMRAKDVKELVASGYLYHGTYGGSSFSVRYPHIGQEISVNEACCAAMADHLKSVGYEAYMTSRVD